MSISGEVETGSADRALVHYGISATPRPQCRPNPRPPFPPGFFRGKTHEETACLWNHCGTAGSVHGARSRARRRRGVRRGVRRGRAGPCGCSRRRHRRLYGGPVHCSVMGAQSIRIPWPAACRRAVHDPAFQQSCKQSRATARVRPGNARSGTGTETGWHRVRYAAALAGEIDGSIEHASGPRIRIEHFRRRPGPDLSRRGFP